MKTQKNAREATVRSKVSLSLGLIVLAAIILPSAASAEIIKIGFTAQVRDVTDDRGCLEGKIKANDLITGNYTYESTTLDSQPAPQVGEYKYYSLPYGIYVNAGGFVFKTDPAQVDFVIELDDNMYNEDSYVVLSRINLPLSNGVSVGSIYWQLNDPSGMALSSTALLTIPPNLSAFQSIWGLDITGGDKPFYYEIRADVTSAYLIPEPCSIVLLGLGGLFLRRKF
jgi:hypothetical protein